MKLRRRAERFFERDYDLVVVGAGAGALGAARAGRWVGARVLVVPGGPITADSTFTDSVPTAAFVAAARQGAGFVEATERARGAVDAVAESKGAPVLRREGIDVIHGAGHFVAPGELAVEGRRVRCGRFVIAGGGQPHRPALPGSARVDIRTARDAFELRRRPASMAVIGAGPTGCALAQAFQRLGVAVTLFERRDRILAREEVETSDIVAAALREQGVDVRAGQEVTALEPAGADGLVRVRAGAQPPVPVERVLAATGVVPDAMAIDVEAAGVELDDAGFVIVDEHLRTTSPGTYAVGDVTGLCPLPHAAFEMGRLAAGHALRKGERGPFRADRVPHVVDTDPQVARVGVTEADVTRRGRVAVLPMAEVDQAILEGRTAGYVKLVSGPRPFTRRLFGGRILGATVVGEHAAEIIGEVALAMRVGVFAGRLAQAPHAYPTWGSSLQRCAAQFVVLIDDRRARPAGR